MGLQEPSRFPLVCSSRMNPGGKGASCLVLVLAHTPGNLCPGQTETVGGPVNSSGPMKYFSVDKVWVSTVQVKRILRGMC